MSEVGARIVVFGTVQGVGFRYFCQRRAEEIGLHGWVKNCQDGTVMLEVEGAKHLIVTYIDRLRMGPSSSRVSDIKADWIDYSGKYSSFQITG